MTEVVAALEETPYLHQQYLAAKVPEAEELPINAFGVQPNTLLVEDGVSTLTMASGGTGYAVDDVLTLVQSGASGCRIKVLTVNGSGVILTWELVTKGTAYSVASTLATTVEPSGGSSATFNVTAIADRAVIDTYTITKSEADVVTSVEVDSSQYKYEIEGVPFAPEDVTELVFA